SGRVEKLQPKEPQTWKTTRRVGKSFANGWRFRRTSDRRQIRPRFSPKVPSSRTSFSAAATRRTTESWDGCCRASAGRDWYSRPADSSDLVLSGTTSAVGAADSAQIEASLQSPGAQGAGDQGGIPDSEGGQPGFHSGPNGKSKF